MMIILSNNTLGNSNSDDLYQEAVDLVIREQKGSTSLFKDILELVIIELQL